MSLSTLCKLSLENDKMPKHVQTAIQKYCMVLLFLISYLDEEFKEK